MASAVPIVLHVFPSPDIAVLRVDPATGEPLIAIAERDLDPVQRQALLDIADALDLVARLQEDPPDATPPTPHR